MENGRVSGPASFRPLLTPCGLELPVLFFSVFADIPSPGSYGQEPDDPAMIGRRVLAARPLPRPPLVDPSSNVSVASVSGNAGGGDNSTCRRERAVQAVGLRRGR